MQVFPRLYAVVAQLVEHLPEEQGVGGSIPSDGTEGSDEIIVWE